MLHTSILANVVTLATIASTALGQTSTDCNPLVSRKFPSLKPVYAFFTHFPLILITEHLPVGCPSDSAVGRNSIECDFTAGACDAFEHLAGRAVTYESSHGLACSMDGPVQAPTLRSYAYIFFGRVEMELQAAPGAGIISTLALQSDDLDEIDFETIGSDAHHIQTNIFSKGNQSDHSHGGSQSVGDAFGKIHHYVINWTPEKIEWHIDNEVARVLLRSEVGEKFPQSPMQVRIGAWVAGYDGADPDTTDWAGGEADFSDGPRTAYYKSIKIMDYAGTDAPTSNDIKAYAYGDHSGRSGSIEIQLQDGSVLTGELPTKSTTTTETGSSSTSSKTETSSVSSTESATNAITSNSSIEIVSHSTSVSEAASTTTTNASMSRSGSSTAPVLRTSRTKVP